MVEAQIAELHDKMVGLKSAAEAIQLAAKDEGERPLTHDEVDDINTLVNEADACKAQIEQLKSDEAAARIEQLKDTLENPVHKTDAGGPRVEVGADLRAKDPKHRFEGMGDFALACYNHEVAGRTDQRLFLGAAASGMQQAVGADGGFAVPPAFATEIWDGMRQDSNNLLFMTDNFTVTGESLTFPANAETSRATGSRYGGVQGRWGAEADTQTSSAPKLRQIKIEPHELYVLIHATNKLLRNSTAIQQFLTRAAIEEINFMTGNAIINGTGAGQPLGILQSDCLIPIDAETTQEAATILTENVTNMFSRLHARSQQRAVWLINQDIWPQLLTMTVGIGTGGAAVFLPPGNTLANAPFGTLYGRPIIPIEYAATLGTVGDIILADMGGYLTGTQGGIDTAMSIHLKFDSAQSSFRFMFAVDGQPWLASAITPFNGATQSTFVALATRS